MNLSRLVSLPVLSVRQPWAAYIVSGIKRIELRSWPTDYRGWLWIHAGKRADEEALYLYGLSAGDFYTGGLLGIADLRSCFPIRSAAEWRALRNEHRSPGNFVQGIYAWQFGDALALSKTIACRGELRLFVLDEETREELKESLLSVAAHQEFLEGVRDLPGQSGDPDPPVDAHS